METIPFSSKILGRIAYYSAASRRVLECDQTCEPGTADRDYCGKDCSGFWGKCYSRDCGGNGVSEQDVE